MYVQGSSQYTKKEKTIKEEISCRFFYGTCGTVVNTDFTWYLCVSVTMGFFDDILIPPESLQQPAKLYPDLMCFTSSHFNPL